MEKIFRLYNNLNSSYFDLISGDKETQQTKGLGLLLSKSRIALKTFLEIPAIKNKIGLTDLSKIGRLVVNCELVSQSEFKLRADIVLRFYVAGKPFKALLIEAKSINKGTSVYATNKQIESYISNKSFYEISEFGNDAYGITLTKYPSYIENKNLVSLTWSDILETFYKAQVGRSSNLSHEDQLFIDYFKFLTNINGTMKFYEKEVFSIPTKKWSSDAISKFHIYECPNRGKYLIKYKPLFLTFRSSGGGKMEKLYKVDEIIILNFQLDLGTFLEDERYDLNIRNNVREYAEYFKKEWGGLPNDEKQVFILSKNSIELKHKPKPKRNNSFRAYYELADLLNNDIVNEAK